MTIKLYDKDAYQTIFEAQVITCTKRENDYDIVLDQTLFSLYRNLVSDIYSANSEPLNKNLLAAPLST